MTLIKVLILIIVIGGLAVATWMWPDAEAPAYPRTAQINQAGGTNH